MNGYKDITSSNKSRPARLVPAALLCLLLSSIAPPIMAAAADAQANSAGEHVVSLSVGEEQEVPIPATDIAIYAEQDAEPDAGTLALLALGLIALGLARKKVRS